MPRLLSMRLLLEIFSLVKIINAGGLESGGYSGQDEATVVPDPNENNKDPFMCYKCSTLEHGQRCGDTFVEKGWTAPQITCSTACVKWVKKAQLGGNVTNIIRTCKDELYIRMFTRYGYCLHEKGTGYGWLCLCKNGFGNKPCNQASLTLATGLAILIPAICAALHLQIF